MNRRLLAVAPVDDPGGAEIHLLRLLAGLGSRGWEITLTTPGRGRLRDMALGAGYRWCALPLDGLGRGAGAQAARSWPRIRALAGAAGVVYLNGTVCGRLVPGHRARRVLHVDDIVSRVPRFWRRADVVLADSGAVAKRLPGLDAHVVYGPVERDPPAVTAPWSTSEGPVVGFVGRIEPRKGPLDLVRAPPAIRAGAPGTRVVLVGDDPYGADAADTRSVLEAATADGVEHYPWSDQAPGLMRNLDVLVRPSYEEPFGTVQAEAMAVGTPVVATRVDGLPEVVEDGVRGRLVAPGSPERVAEAGLEVLGRRDEMGAAARARAERLFVDDYVERVERLIAA